jgi:hypothetical protein
LLESVVVRQRFAALIIFKAIYLLLCATDDYDADAEDAVSPYLELSFVAQA